MHTVRAMSNTVLVPAATGKTGQNMEADVSTTVLVTGPTGKVGRRLIPLLARRGMTVRTASRSPLPERAGIEPVRFDWTDESTYETARKGVVAMYLVAGPVPQPEHADYIRDLLDGAAAAGVERVVLPLTLTQVAEHISWVAGRRIRYVETDRTPMRDALLAAGAPPETAEHNSRLHVHAFSSGAMGVLNDDVLDVTSRPPVSFAEFAAGAAAAWRRKGPDASHRPPHLTTGETG